MKREFSAGGVCFKRENGKVLVVIYKPENRNTWQLPKGLIDKGETSAAAAIREVAEEGGVKGKILDKIGTHKFFYTWEGEKRFKIVDYYLMEYVTGNPEKDHGWEAEKAEWVEIDEAIARLTFAGEKEIVRKAKLLIASS